MLTKCAKWGFSAESTFYNYDFKCRMSRYDAQSPLIETIVPRGGAGFAALAAVKIPRHCTPRNFHMGSAKTGGPMKDNHLNSLGATPDRRRPPSAHFAFWCYGLESKHLSLAWSTYGWAEAVRGCSSNEFVLAFALFSGTLLVR